VELIRAFLGIVRIDSEIGWRWGFSNFGTAGIDSGGGTDSVMFNIVE